MRLAHRWRRLGAMCGRYALVDGKTAAERFGIGEFVELRIPVEMPRFNIGPAQPILAVRQAEERRVGELMRWGYRPVWMKPGKLPPPINAKAENLTESAMWKRGLRKRRVLVPASGFYEWQASPGRKAKQPHFIRLKDRGLFGFAGLSTADGEGQATAAIVTTSPNELMQPIHNRMPVILLPEDEATWLDPEVPTEVALACLRPYPAELMEAYPVGPDVGNVRNDGPELVERLDQ